MMSEVVWISKVMSRLTEYPPMMHSFSEDNRAFGIECGEKNADGASLGPECFPDEIWLAPGARSKLSKLPNLCFGGSYWFVSKRCADVIKQFDLGGGALYPVRVFQADRATPIGNEWFCLNFGNLKQAFLPEESQNVRAVAGGAWRPKDTFVDGDVAFSAAAASGPDIWLDALLRHVICLSDDLVRALTAAKTIKAFDPIRRARIV